MTVLLIDADIIVYQATSVVEKEVQWDEDTFTLHSSLDDAKAVFYDTFYQLKEQAYIDEVVFCFSDRANWRKELDPTYKAHRKGMRKPLAYGALRDYITDKYRSRTMPRLEADDAIGIEATSIEDAIIWSLDKDLKQIPGLHLIDDEVVPITKQAADRFHLYQTLVGDSADGYKGCPGIGPVKAERIVDGGWEAVVGAYVKVGLTEEDALHQARLARILRSGEYDTLLHEVKLWKP